MDTILQADQTQHISRVNTFEYTPTGTTAMTVIQLSKIDLSLLTQLEDYLRSEAVDTVKAKLEGQSPDVQRIMMDSALALGDRRRIGTAEFDRAVQSLSGMMYLLYLSMLAKHPDATPESVRKIFSDINDQGPNKLAELTSKLFNVTGFKTGAPGKAGAGKNLTLRTPKARR